MYIVFVCLYFGENCMLFNAEQIRAVSVKVIYSKICSLIFYIARTLKVQEKGDDLLVNYNLVSCHFFLIFFSVVILGNK